MVAKLPPSAEGNWTAESESSPSNTTNNMALYLRSRESGVSPTAYPGRITRGIAGYMARRLPGSYGTPRDFDTDGMDKVFAATWLDDDQVIMGTKCNRVGVMTIETGRKVWIPLIGSDDNQVAVSSGSPVEMASPTSSTPISTTVPWLLGSLERRQADYASAHGTGIRCMAMNTLCTLIAIGVGKPLGSIQIYKLPTFEPVGILHGHRDMVFSLAWVTDTLLVSGARDTTVRTWDIRSLLFRRNSHPHQLSSLHKQRSRSALSVHSKILRPSTTFREHRGKVRDMQYSAPLAHLATLSTDGYVKLWDARQMRVGTAIPLRYTEETCCLAMSNTQHTSAPLYAVGSAHKISVLDSRAKDVVLTFDSLDDGWGVRSLLFDDTVLTVGGGKGRISFYDLRMPAYISWNNDKTGSEALNYLDTGPGYLLRDDVYEENFGGHELKNAVYVLAKRNTRLFAAGGPLQMSLRGSYAAIW
ncbi:WD40-repeat-containing domain protein [Powellomyces hirtus]|nr:WD40-repeat-containing domain protein [Powellomyces hirtus]